MIIKITLVIFAALIVLKAAGISSISWFSVVLVSFGAFFAMLVLVFVMAVVSEILERTGKIR